MYKISISPEDIKNMYMENVFSCVSIPFLFSPLKYVEIQMRIALLVIFTSSFIKTARFFFIQDHLTLHVTGILEELTSLWTRQVDILSAW